MLIAVLLLMQLLLAVAAGHDDVMVMDKTFMIVQTLTRILSMILPMLAGQFHQHEHHPCQNDIPPRGWDCGLL